MKLGRDLAKNKVKYPAFSQHTAQTMTNNLRKYLLLTLSHAERSERLYYNSALIVGKVRSLFNCEAIIVARESHKEKGFHYHVGVLNDSASSKTATKMIRASFSEFSGSQLNVSFHKSWNTICSYVVKQDRSPYCWNTTAEECRERAARQKAGKRTLDSISMLRECTTWESVLEQPKLLAQVLRSYSSVKQTWTDLQKSKSLPSLEERLREYLSLLERKHGRAITAYTLSELGDRSVAMDWLGRNLSTERPHRSAQLLIVGPPAVGKSKFIGQLQEFLMTYEVPMRQGDFSGASTNVDLWVIDEFSNSRMPSGILNAVLDGQRVGLDCKYGHVFYKDKNIPIVLICTEIPGFSSTLEEAAFVTRVSTTKFLSPVTLESERVARTLLDRLESRNRKQLTSSIIALASFAKDGTF